MHAICSREANWFKVSVYTKGNHHREHLNAIEDPEQKNQRQHYNNSPCTLCEKSKPLSIAIVIVLNQGRVSKMIARVELSDMGNEIGNSSDTGGGGDYLPKFIKKKDEKKLSMVFEETIAK